VMGVGGGGLQTHVRSLDQTNVVSGGARTPDQCWNWGEIPEERRGEPQGNNLVKIS